MQELRTDRYKLKELFPDKTKKYAQKLHKKAGEIEFIRKGIPIDPKDIGIKEGERAAIRLVTTPHLDRDGEILIPSGAILDDFRQSPSVLYGHDYKGLPVGSDQWIKQTKEGILAKTIYAKHQFAEDVYQCVKAKHLNSNSVGFIPIEAVNREDDKKAFAEWQGVLEKDYGIEMGESDKAKTIYTKWLMLEHSDVPVASNAQSLNLAVSKGEITIKSPRLKKDLEIEVVKDKDVEIEVIKGKDGVTTFSPPIANNDKEIEVIKDKNDKEEKEIKGEKAEKAGAKEEKETITKPETTDQYHRIPVNPGCKITATITISAKEGIKALYCGEVKKIHTYLFDVEKWTMAEAKKWVSENKDFADIKIKEPGYKERWNKSLSKAFDIAAVQAPIASFSYALYEKFLECKVKDVFLNSYSIPSPLLGTYLAGFKKILGDFKLKDTRSFNWDGGEVPPVSEIIKLNSDKSDDFLINGVCFYDANGKPLIVKFSSGWSGIDVSLVTANENKEWNKDLLDKVHNWAYENNFLRGEKFALSGEFLDEPGDNWDNLILDSKYKDSIIKSANFLEKKGKNLTGRGLLFIGPPGTGKTKTGRVLMNELDTTFIWVSSRDFRQVGPLRALALGFSLARDLSPSILFLEDIDTWLRGEMEFVTDLVKAEMDGIKQNKGLITIMTSNYPEKLPDALLDRPGRFHHIINFELPGSKERTQMLTLWAGDIEKDLFDDIVEKTKGFSGAHLKELVEFAKMIAEEDELGIGKALLKSLDKLIEQRELIEEIKGNKVDVKAFWDKVKWIDGNIKMTKEIEIKKDNDEKQEKFNCECISCGYKMESEEHCDKIKCPKCGGDMRRSERPGPGKETEFEIKGDSVIDGSEVRTELAEKGVILGDDKLVTELRIMDIPELKENLNMMQEQIVELKEGRVLSTKNRTMVKDTIDALTALKEHLDELYNATEPVSRDEEKETKIATEKSLVIEKDVKKPELDTRLAKAIEKILSGDNLKELLGKAVGEAVDIKIKRKLGRVE